MPLEKTSIEYNHPEIPDGSNSKHNDSFARSGFLLTTAAQNMALVIAPVFVKRLVSNYDTNLPTTILILEETVV